MATLLDLLASSPETRADAAIRAPGRTELTYPGLLAQVEGTGRALRGAGVGDGDRVAIVLPNGPAMASAFACIAPWCAAAPLNPAYKGDEFDFYLSDLDATALIVAAGDDTVARDVASRRGTRVIELAWSPTRRARSRSTSKAKRRRGHRTRRRSRSSCTRRARPRVRRWSR